MTAPDLMPDGVYFDLPEDRYHAEPRLSASGIKRILQSPLDFYVRSWFAGEDREPEEQSDQMDAGKAYHKRIVEGREAFYRAYDVAFDPSAHPDALRTVDDIRAELKERGLKLGGNKDELIDRLLEAEPEMQIIDCLREEWEDERLGKTLLSPKLIRRIEVAAAMIEKHPDLSKAFTGGRPEVSIFWTDAESGVKMKSRIDYIKRRAFVDLKSYSNPYGKPLHNAVMTAFAGGRYQIQIAVYAEAIRVAVEQFGLEGEAERDAFFVFQSSGPAPVALGYRLPRSTVFDVGRLQMQKGIEIYKRFSETFGTDPWIEPLPVRDIDDLEVPNYALEGM